MREVDRRRFLRNAGLAGAGLLSAGSLSALLSGCAADTPTAGSSTAGSSAATTSAVSSAASSSALSSSAASSSARSAGSMVSTSLSGVIPTPKMGITSALLPTYLPQIGGPVLYGANFGLKIVEDNFTIFDSSTTLTQSTLSGQNELAGQSTMAQLLLIEQGLPFKIFGTYVLTDDLVIAARNGIKSIDDLRKPGIVVATDSPGGSSQTAFDACLQAAGADFLVADLKTVIIESSGARTSALASGDCDAACLHVTQASQIQAEKGDVTIIARLYETVPQYMKDCWVARTDWLDQNLPTATAIVASTIQASRDLRASKPKFEAAVKQLIDEPPPADQVDLLFDVVNKNEVWPVDGGLSNERAQFMIDLGKREKFLTKDLTPDQVMDMRPMQEALKLLGPE